MTVFDRVKMLADKQKISIVELEEKIGFGRNSLYSWKKKVPNGESLNKVADYFNVSTDYLLGRTDNPALASVPEWATERDIIDLEEMLDSNVNMAYGGQTLTDEEKQRVKDVLTGIFWDKLQKEKRS
ncbi:helix-turn-helix domain-containing protein [Vagococcus elongatus]|uniref:Transcriptional regulator n=1 Tax=Vagococcus elongatus TaxID=180344 RepID=A0A430AU64_9ENTE|nr:helix-turn-helix transcriptional regulator [Vagococcus elongatus]RSU11598.1 transcriptional regulator [Vagococcus elongatus]